MPEFLTDVKFLFILRFCCLKDGERCFDTSRGNFLLREIYNLMPFISFHETYSGVQLKRDDNVSFCASITTESIKANNIPLKSPTKLLPKNEKKILIFKNFWTFRVLFDKMWFWKMGNFETHQYFWMKLSGGLPHLG